VKEKKVGKSKEKEERYYFYFIVFLKKHVLFSHVSGTAYFLLEPYRHIQHIRWT